MSSYLYIEILLVLLMVLLYFCENHENFPYGSQPTLFIWFTKLCGNKSFSYLFILMMIGVASNLEEMHSSALP